MAYKEQAHFIAGLRLSQPHTMPKSSLVTEHFYLKVFQ